MDMVCDSCGRNGIRWMGPFSNLTHTECPHCGGINCQRAESVEPDDKPDDQIEITPAGRAELWNAGGHRPRLVKEV